MTKSVRIFFIYLVIVGAVALIGDYIANNYSRTTAEQEAFGGPADFPNGPNPADFPNRHDAFKRVPVALSTPNLYEGFALEKSGETVNVYKALLTADGCAVMKRQNEKPVQLKGYRFKEGKEIMTVNPFTGKVTTR